MIGRCCAIKKNRKRPKKDCDVLQFVIHGRLFKYRTHKSWQGWLRRFVRSVSLFWFCCEIRNFSLFPLFCCCRLSLKFLYTFYTDQFGFVEKFMNASCWGRDVRLERLKSMKVNEYVCEELNRDYTRILVTICTFWKWKFLFTR